MTGNDIFRAALAVMSESPEESDGLGEYALQWLNLLLEECLAAENSCRERSGQEILERAPQLATLGEEVPYCDKLCRVALPYGMAASLWTDDDNDYRANKWMTLYRDAVSEAAGAVMTVIEDIY